MKTYLGKVVSAKMAKTVVIEREILYRHPLYKKIVRRKRRLKIHTDFPVTVGQVVKYTAVRPLSKDKHYKVVEINKSQ